MADTDRLYTSLAAERKRAQLVKAAIERLEQEVSQLDPASAASVQTCEAIVEELT